MSIEILNISAVPKKKRRNGNPFLSSYYAKKYGTRPCNLGTHVELDNPPQVSVVKAGRLNHKKT